MRTLALTTLLAVATTVASAQAPAPETPAPAAPTVTQPQRTDTTAAQVLATIPTNAMTVTHWYKQSVYDPANSKIGDIEDVLIDKDAKVVALVIGVGGFLGLGEKHVAVPYDAVRMTTKDSNKWYLVMNSTKDALKNAPGYKFDRTAMTWMPENATTGSGTPSRPVTPTAPVAK
jgi:sporulation protein YlmC with PRC-barrel domain